MLSALFYAGDANLTAEKNTTESFVDNNLSLLDGNRSIFANEESENIEFIALQAQLDDLRSKEEKESVWSKIYSTYNTYQNLKNKKEKLVFENKKLTVKKKKSSKQKEELKKNEQELQTLNRKLESLRDLESDPFRSIVEPPEMEKMPKVGNPLKILEALSYSKTITQQQIEYENKYKTLQDEVYRLDSEQSLLDRMLKLKPDSMALEAEFQELEKELEILTSTLEIFETTKDVYAKKVEEAKIKIDDEIIQEYDKMVKIAGIVIVFFLFFLLIKYILRRYMSSKDSYYTVNKVTNFIFLTILGLVLLFAYIENVSYMVTVIGFASAGIAIAMKDWFMSLMGWWVIVIGGSVHVGDRVKFVKDGVEYVGDIVDISPLRMTMQEDVTLTTVMKNRRAGRVIFIPNNYIFTDMIANYSHAGLKTVWDGIDFSITYDSNVDKAMSIARDVTKKYSKGYTDITRSKLNNLRSKYHIKNTNVEPRILSFIEPHGILISSWYLTNSYATLTLRSKISVEIIQKIQQCNDIKIAYPTQSLYLDNHIPKPQVISPEPSLFDV